VLLLKSLFISFSSLRKGGYEITQAQIYLLVSLSWETFPDKAHGTPFFKCICFLDKGDKGGRGLVDSPTLAGLDKFLSQLVGQPLWGGCSAFSLGDASGDVSILLEASG
jgi:hypothetical protein